MNTFHPPSQKNSPLLLSTPTQASCYRASSQRVVKPATPRGRGVLPTHQRLRANRMEPCKMCLLRALQNIHKSTIRTQRKPWHYPGLTRSWHSQPEGVQRHWAMWTLPDLHWGSLLTLLIQVIIWTLQHPLLSCTQAQTTDIKVIFSEKIYWSRLSFMKNNSLFQTVPLQSRCLCLIGCQAQLMFWLQINICLAFNSLTPTVPCSHLQHNVVWNHPCEVEVLIVTLVTLSQHWRLLPHTKWHQ